MKAKHQSQRKLLLLFLLMGSWLGIQPAKAQFTANFQTNIISVVTSNWPGNYFVGSNTFANALLIRNGGRLTNADGHVGYTPASSSNYVMVAGTGSAWSNANLYLGYSGGGNTLVISNAGHVANSQGAYAAYDAASSSNRVLVTGTNSVWDCANNLFLGVSGSWNSLVISNGGRVNDSYSELGDEYYSSGNSALITGAGSVWNNTSTCTIGRAGGHNQLTVNKGGRLYSFYANLGMFDSSPGNSVVISDTNSIWDDSGETSTMNIGMSSSGNSIVVTNGAKILGYFVYLGRFGSANSNSVLVTGPGSTYSLNCHFYVGNQGRDNWFTAANGATILDKFCYINYEAASSNNAVLLTGTNTSWHNEYSVFVGFAGGGGSLTLSNGAKMTAVQHASLGYEAASRDNRAVITGGGTVLNPTMNVYVGSDGPANSLVISNGAKVIDDYGSLGLFPSSVSNSATVVGSGSIWTNSSNFYVGHSSVGNSLVISNGAKVYDVRGYVGWDGDGNDNNVLVSGTGSVWSNSYATLVGNIGSGNTMVIRNGGLVGDFWGIIGEDDPSTDNTVYVEPGGTWRTQRLRVGDYGSHNALFVNGGSVFAGSTMDVGYDPLYYDDLCQLNSGEINVTNAAHNAVLEVYGGSFLLAGGTLRVDTLIVTNSGAQFMKIGGTLSYRALQLNPAFDADADGIPNGWEQAKGLDPFDPFDAEADKDGDGMINLQEYMAGTNPTNAASSLRITSQVLTGSNVRVSWSAVGGKSYIVQKSSAPGAGFADLSPVISIPGVAETTTNYLHVGGATNLPGCYYRVRLAP